MEIIALIITNILAPIITGVVTWLLAKRKYNSEVDNNLINNMKESLEFYKNLSDDNKDRLEEVLKRNEQMEKEIMQLRGQVFALMDKICYSVTCQLRVRETMESLKEQSLNVEDEESK